MKNLIHYYKPLYVHEKLSSEDNLLVCWSTLKEDCISWDELGSNWKVKGGPWPAVWLSTSCARRTVTTLGESPSVMVTTLSWSSANCGALSFTSSTVTERVAVDVRGGVPSSTASTLTCKTYAFIFCCAKETD